MFFGVIVKKLKDKPFFLSLYIIVRGIFTSYDFSFNSFEFSGSIFTFKNSKLTTQAIN